MPALVVPLMLIIMLAVVTSFFSQTTTSFETGFVNESVAVSGNKGYVTYPPIAKVDKIYNQSDVLLTAVTDYNITEANENGEISFKATLVGTPVKVSYTGHSGEGWTSFKTVRTGTFGGYKLASLLPYIIIAMVVLGLLLGAFLVKGV